MVVWQFLSGFGTLTHPAPSDCDKEEKRFVIFVYFIMTIQIDDIVIVFALLEAGLKICQVANFDGSLAQLSSQSRSGWTITKVWTDVRAVTGRVLWIMTACGIPFEAVLGRLCTNMQGNLKTERQLFDELLQNWEPNLVSHAWYPRQAPSVKLQGACRWPQISYDWSHLLGSEDLDDRSFEI